MSIKVMTLVWDRYPGSGSDLLAMLALADWGTDNGGRIYPSIATLAAKIRVSVSQARRVLHRLIEEGYVRVVGNENGGAPGMTRDYQLNVAKLRALPVIEADMKERGSTDASRQTSHDDEETASMDARGSMDARAGMDARDGWHGCAQTAGTHASQTVSRTVIEPLEEIEGGAQPGKPAKSEAKKPWFDLDSGKVMDLPATAVAKWSEAYPAIHVPLEIAKAEAWLLANPKNRKSDYVRFLNGWLSRAQDKAPRVLTGQMPRRASNGRGVMNDLMCPPPEGYADDLFGERTGT